MAQYNPNEDISYGIAGADFPITFYDRPQLAFGNLLKGNVDAATRAIFSPQTLTPNEMKTVRDTLFQGKKPNAILKTVTDIATNPLVIAGLVVGLWKFPLGTTKALLELRRGLVPKAAAMSKMMSGLHGSMMNLRSVSGLFEALLGVTTETTKFMAKYGDDANAIFLKAGRLSKAEGTLVSARLDGLHKSSHYMVKALRNEPEWIAFMGGRDVPIAPGIQRVMDSRLVGLSTRLRGWYDNTRKALGKSPEALERIKKAVEKKGLRFGEDVEDYFPRHGQFNKYYKKAIRGTTGVQYRTWLHGETGARVGREQIARTGGMFANFDDIQLLEQSGAIKPGFTDMVKTVMARRSRIAATKAQEIWGDVTRLGFNESQARVEFVRRMRDYYTKGGGKNLDFVRRLGNKNMADDTLDAMAGTLQDATFKGGGAVQKELFEIGRTLAEPAQYTLNPWEATGRYLSSVASSYAWHGTGFGEKIMTITKKPGVYKNAPWIESYLMDDLIPHVRGLKSYKELQRSIAFSSAKEKVYNWLQTTPIAEQTVGKKGKDWLLKYFGDTSKSFSAEGVGSKVAHSFYLSTLGFNISPVSQNLLQNFLVTMNTPGIGPQGIYRGLMGVRGGEGVLKKMQNYLRMITTGTGTKAAFRKAFPEYIDDMGDASQIVESMLAGDVAKEGIAGKFLGVKGKWEQVKTAMLMPFSTSEGFNRLLGYYAGRNSHLFHNAGKLSGANEAVRGQIFKQAGQVGQTLTMTTHFTGGPLGIPKALINMWAPWRQFMHFPARFLAYLHGSLRMGPDPSKLDWGTIGRTVAGSTAAYVGARNLLGVDISSGLAAGALPVPTYEKSPFYPFPLVSPLMSVIGMGAKALFTGSAEDLEGAASLLIPGGIAAKKVYRSLSPKYADYRNRTPDGRIPLYNDNHALIGTMSPMQLTLRALGLKSSGLAAEQGAAKWMLAQREKLRAYRREYLQALMENDNRKAENIQRDFQKSYPELGPLQVKKSDIKALENRREISRLHRIEKGFPSAYRGLFSQIIGEASLARVTEDIEAGSTGLEAYLQ